MKRIIFKLMLLVIAAWFSNVYADGVRYSTSRMEVI